MISRPITRTQLSVTIDIKLRKLLDELSKRTRIPKARLVDEAIELLLAEHSKGEQYGNRN